MNILKFVTKKTFFPVSYRKCHFNKLFNFSQKQTLLYSIKSIKYFTLTFRICKKLNFHVSENEWNLKIMQNIIYACKSKYYHSFTTKCQQPKTISFPNIFLNDVSPLGDFNFLIYYYFRAQIFVFEKKSSYFNANIALKIYHQISKLSHNFSSQVLKNHLIKR